MKLTIHLEHMQNSLMFMSQLFHRISRTQWTNGMGWGNHLGPKPTSQVKLLIVWTNVCIYFWYCTCLLCIIFLIDLCITHCTTFIYVVLCHCFFPSNLNYDSFDIQVGGFLQTSSQAYQGNRHLTCSLVPGDIVEFKVIRVTWAGSVYTPPSRLTARALEKMVC